MSKKIEEQAWWFFRAWYDDEYQLADLYRNGLFEMLKESCPYDWSIHMEKLRKLEAKNNHRKAEIRSKS